MTELDEMRGTVAQLQGAVDGIDDAFGKMGMKIAVDILANTLRDATVLNAARVNDVAFVFNDVAAAAGELSAPDAEMVTPMVSSLESTLDRLRADTALPGDLLSAMEDIKVKLKARASAIDKSTYVEGAAAALPHPPAELRAEALPIRDRLAAAGFATPALDALIDAPDSLVFQTIRDIIDELEAVSGF